MTIAQPSNVSASLTTSTSGVLKTGLLSLGLCSFLFVMMVFSPLKYTNRGPLNDHAQQLAKLITRLGQLETKIENFHEETYHNDAKVKDMNEESDLLPSVVVKGDDMDWCGPLMSGKGVLDKGENIPLKMILMKGPMARVKAGSGKCVDGSVRWFSQYRQDVVLWEKHFKFLGRRGIYMDVATNDPIKISNTYFFDRCLGWKGVCVEANEKYFEDIHSYRSCHLVPTCVSDKKEKVIFRLDAGLGGIETTNKNRKEGKKTTEMECTTLGDVLQEKKVKLIDYLSLDVEGHELQVLKGIDWKKTKINIMTVETGPGSPVDKFLKGRGYRVYTPEETHLHPWFSNYEMIYYAQDVSIGAPL